MFEFQEYFYKRVFLILLSIHEVSKTIESYLWFFLIFFFKNSYYIFSAGCDARFGLVTWWSRWLHADADVAEVVSHSEGRMEEGQLIFRNDSSEMFDESENGKDVNMIVGQ